MVRLGQRGHTLGLLKSKVRRRHALGLLNMVRLGQTGHALGLLKSKVRTEGACTGTVKLTVSLLVSALTTRLASLAEIGCSCSSLYVL